jgi:hypothetical protein
MTMAAAASTIPELFYEEGSLGIFILVTVILGGGAAALAGRAIALTWRPLWQIVAYTLILGGAVRFIHFALFDGTLLSVHYFIVDSAICMALGSIGFRGARRSQMLTHYWWLTMSDGALRWRRKPP